MARSIGIDIGGTKIEATVFADDWSKLHSQRVPTPHDTYENLVSAVIGQAQWARAKAGRDVPVGIGIPGLHNRETGLASTANIPATGHSFRADLTTAIGCHITYGNDCDLFALSEARLGAGQGYQTVFGLIIGTGIGAGICHDGHVITTLNGGAGEVGHIPVSGRLTLAYDLPVLTCGCGQKGCAETLASGLGLTRLAKLVAGADLPPPEIARLLAQGDDQALRIMQIWSEIMQELLGSIQRTIDPDIIVLGGGLTHIEGLVDWIKIGLENRMLRGSTSPEIVLAKYGDSSGTRGAAIAALSEQGVA
ncbi:MAG TPA: ROK family protein [Aliiroseovarius sp.]|nr:ROK family protein [Aliiroseovarius sp.]